MNRRKIALLLTLIFMVMTDRCSNDKPKQISTKTSIQSKKQLSQEKLQIVTTLSSKLEEKKTKLTVTKQKFDLSIQSNADELNAEGNKSNLQNFEQSMSNKKIGNYLRLIQKATAYRELVENEINLTDTGLIELDATAKQLELDIIMLDGMAEEKLDELLSKLDLTIKDITPQANDLVFPDDPSNKKPLEALYEEYVTKVKKQKEAAEQAELQKRQKEEKLRAEKEKEELLKRQKEEKLRLEKEKEELLRRQKEDQRNAILEPNYHLSTGIEEYKKLVWCPTKNLLAIVSEPLMIWDFISNSLLKIPVKVQDATWIPGSNGERMLFLSTCDDGLICLKHWSLKTNSEILSISLTNIHHVYDFIGWSGTNIAIKASTENYDKRFVIWNEAQRTVIKTFSAVDLAWKDESSFFYTDETTVYLYDLTTASVVASQNQCINESENIASKQCPRYMQIFWNKTNGSIAINARYAKSLQPETNTITFWDTKKQRKILSDTNIFFALVWLSKTTTLLADQNNKLVAIMSTNNQPYETGFMTAGHDYISCSSDKPCCAIHNRSDNPQIICQSSTGTLETMIRLKNELFFDATWSFSGRRLAARSRDGVDIWDLGKYIY